MHNLTHFTVEICVTPGSLNILETIRLEAIPNNRTKLSACLRFQNMRFLAKPMGDLAARFLETRIKRIDRLMNNEGLNTNE